MTSFPSFVRQAFSPRLLGLGAALLAAAPVAPAADWQSLVNNTPFGQAPATPAGATGDLEFRGVVQEDNGYLINLYNPTTKTSQWIPVKGSAPGLEVKSYDASSDRVQITQAGRPLTLTLKQSKIALVAATNPNTANGEKGDPTQEDRRNQIRDMIRARMEGGGVEGGPGNVLRNMPPEAQAMIEEFRRRRAEAGGAQSAQPGDPNQPAQPTQARRVRPQQP